MTLLERIAAIREHLDQLEIAIKVLEPPPQSVLSDTYIGAFSGTLTAVILSELIGMQVPVNEEGE